MIARQNGAIHEPRPMYVFIFLVLSQQIANRTRLTPIVGAGH
jgi:hypothetical protein